MINQQQQARRARGEAIGMNPSSSAARVRLSARLGARIYTLSAQARRRLQLAAIVAYLHEHTQIETVSHFELSPLRFWVLIAAARRAGFVIPPSVRRRRVARIYRTLPTEAAVATYYTTHTLHETARHFSIASARARKLIRAAGGKIRRRGETVSASARPRRPPSPKMQAIVAYVATHTIADAAAHFGMTQRQISTWIWRARTAGITVSVRPAPRRRPARSNPPAADVVARHADVRAAPRWRPVCGRA